MIIHYYISFLTLLFYCLFPSLTGSCCMKLFSTGEKVAMEMDSNKQKTMLIGKKPSLIDTETINGDNCGNFLTLGGMKMENGKQERMVSSVFWHQTEQEGLTQFVLAKLPKHMAAHSDVFNAIASTGGLRNTSTRTEIAAGITAVSEAINRFVTALEDSNTAEQDYWHSKETCRLEEEIFQIEMKIAEPDVQLYHKNIMVKRELKLEDDLLKLNNN